MYNFELTKFPDETGKAPHEIKYVDVFEKIDTMSEALKQPKFADACGLLMRFMATLNKERDT